MSDSSRPVVGTSPVTRSLGLKLIVILILIVLMSIPVMFISFVSFERSSRADDVTRDVSQTYGGQQRILGPVVTVPYRQTLSGNRLREGDFVISTVRGDAVLENVSVEEKSRSLYTVPVYTADARLSGTLPNLADVLPSSPDYQFDLDAAKIVVGIQDVTGLQSDVTLQVGDQTLTFEPYRAGRLFRASDYGAGVELPTVAVEAESNRRRERNLPEVITDRLSGAGLTLLSVAATDQMMGTDVEARMTFTGATQLSIIPHARTTELRLSSDWPHPGFTGRFPPSEREIGDDGFSAVWTVPFLRRGIPAQGGAGEMSGLVRGQSDLQVTFVSPLDPYQTVNRALKYAVLFIGLVFLAYFLMETLLGVRVHPAQYLLIGIAQAVFYLLLLAFAEQIGFTLAFGLSAVATVALTAGYAGAVFGRDTIWKSALVFSAVYGLLFVLMRIQDFALMVGALTCFVAIAATLYLTRNLDWYGGR